MIPARTKPKPPPFIATLNNFCAAARPFVAISAAVVIALYVAIAVATVTIIPDRGAKLSNTTPAIS